MLIWSSVSKNLENVVENNDHILKKTQSTIKESSSLIRLYVA